MNETKLKIALRGDGGIYFAEWGSPNNKRHFLVWELVDVHVRDRIRIVETAGEVVWKLIELAELPLRKGRVASTADI